MKEIIKKVDNNNMFLEINSSIYDVKAILNAMYKFTGMCYMHSEAISTDVIRIFFKVKNNNSLFLDQITNEFCNELIDQQVRLNVEKEYGKIRDEIVKKAFSPIEL